MGSGTDKSNNKVREELELRDAELQDAKTEIHRLEELLRVSRIAHDKDATNMQKVDRYFEDNAGMKIGIRKLTKANTELEQKNVALRVLLKGTDMFPVLEVLDTLDTLNGSIDKISTFLAENLEPVSQELFQQDIDLSREATQLIFGHRLMEKIITLSQRPGPSSLPLNEFFIKSIFQIFMVNFCRSEVNMRRDSMIQLTPNEKDLKTRYLHQISNIFKTTSWALAGSKRRHDFEEQSEPFFRSLKALLESESISGKDTPFRLGVISEDTPLTEDEESDDDKEGESYILDEERAAGTIAIGLKRMKEVKGGEKPGFEGILSASYYCHSDLTLHFYSADQPKMASTAKITKRASRAQEDGRP